VAETHGHGHGAHAGPTFNTYIAVFLALCVLTAITYAVDQILAGTITAFTVILLIAVVKASLVILFFMHLKYDWGKLYFLIIPVVILGAMMMVVLLPDIVLGWQPSLPEDLPPPAP
jgi:cytochrome c oxidase subunit IV